MSKGNQSYAGVMEVVRPGRPASALVLFLPGLSGNLSQWAPVLPYLADEDLTIAYGAPIRPHPAFMGARPTVLGLAGLIADEIRIGGYTKVLIVAHSVGSFVALAISRTLGERVKSVILINGGLATVGRFLDHPVSELVRSPRVCLSALRLFVLAGSPAPESVKRAILGSERGGRALLGEFVGEQTLQSRAGRGSLIEHGGSPEVLRVLWINRHHWPEFLSYADTIRATVTFMVGDKDPMTSEIDTRTMASLLPSARVVVLEGVSHVAPIETAQEVANVVLSDLRGAM